MRSSTTTKTRGVFRPQPNCFPSLFLSPPASFSCFATSLLIYSPSACLQPSRELLSHSRIPPETQGERKRRQTCRTSMHIRTHCGGCLQFTGVFTHPYPKKGFLTGDDMAVVHWYCSSHSFSVPLSLASTCLFFSLSHIEIHT